MIASQTLVWSAPHVHLSTALAVHRRAIDAVQANGAHFPQRRLVARHCQYVATPSARWMNTGSGAQQLYNAKVFP